MVKEKSGFSDSTRDKILEWGNGVIRGKKIMFSERCEKIFSLKIARYIRGMCRHRFMTRLRVHIRMYWKLVSYREFICFTESFQ